jgi:hypothetical protein
MNNIQKCKEAEKQGLRVQYNNPVSNTWVDGSWVYWEGEDRYRIHPDDLHKFIDPELKTENPEKISEKPFKFSEKSSELLENPEEFMEILTSIQKTLLKSSKDFKFSYETQGDKIKIEVLIQKDSVKQEDDDGWISNEGNSTCYWPEGYGITEETWVEVKYRDNTSEEGTACSWKASWCEVDGKGWDIMKFRIIK